MDDVDEHTVTIAPEAILDRIVDELPGLTKAERNERVLQDDFLDLAIKLGVKSPSYARLLARLGRIEVKINGFKAAVKWRAAEREAAHRPAAKKRDEGRPSILITTEEAEVNEQAIRAISALPNLYQRFGQLVRVIESMRRRPGEAEPHAVEEIRTITEPLLRELFTRAATWSEEKMVMGCAEIVPAHPPDWSVRAVQAWGKWPRVRPLYHVAEIPTLLPDGSIISAPGYDEDMGILYRPKVDLPEILEYPTQEDAAGAAAQLLDLVAEIPFENVEHRSAWLAALLTPVARWAYTGQNPMFMLDANQSGSGKGLALKVIAWITQGREMDFMVPTDDENEERKRVTSKIIAGATMVLIDNIEKPFGSPVIEGLLTSGVWSDRLLGGNSAPTFDAWVTWYGSANNVRFKREDTSRRCCLIRIVTTDLRPEQRSGFRYPDLEAHVLEHRAELLAAALTLLRAWLRSGQRAEDLKGWGGPWGSFNGWDRMVRGAIVFAGLVDPIAAKGTAGATQSNQDGLQMLLEGLEEAGKQLGGASQEFTSSKLWEALNENDEWRRADKGTTALRFKTLRNAFSALDPSNRCYATTVGLGRFLGRYMKKPVATSTGHKWLVSRNLHGGSAWKIEAITPASASTADTDGMPAPAPPLDPWDLVVAGGHLPACPNPDCRDENCRYSHPAP